MSDEQQRRGALTTFVKHPAMEVTLAILGLTAIAAPIGWLQDYQVSPYLILAALGAVLLAFYFVRKETRILRLPGFMESKHFFPFISHSGIRSEEVRDKLYSRESEALALREHLETDSVRHCFLVGDSGVGKSMMLQYFFSTGSDAHLCEPIVEYETFFVSVHNRLMKALTGRELEKFQRAYRDMMEAIDDCDPSDARSFERCVGSIEEYVQASRSEKRIVLIFDQAERAIRLIKSSQDVRQQSKLARELISELRKASWINTLFVLRADLAIEAVELMIDYEASPVFGSTQKYVNFFVLSGVNVGAGSENYAKLREKFLSVAGTGDFRSLSSALQIATPTLSNTFLIQLTGYLFEHFGEADSVLMEGIRDSTRLGPRMMDAYLERLSAEYYTASLGNSVPAADAKSALWACLFALAEENRGAGRAISILDIAALTHFPSEQVATAMRFLSDKGICQKTQDHGLYRIAHDLLAEHILKSETVGLRADYKNVYRSYSDLPGNRERHSTAESQRNIFIDLINRRPVSVPQIFILFCMLLCLFRVVWPSEAFSMLAPVNAAIDAVLPGAIQTFDFRLEYYLPIMIVHFLWVSFMYKLDRGYFARVLSASDKTRAFSVLGAPLGALLGVLLMFAPSLFIVPIIAGGVFLATAYSLHAISLPKSGLASKNARELAVKIWFNMAVSIGSTLICVTLLVTDLPHVDGYFKLMVILFFTACFGWYWYAMQPRQGSQEGWSTLLLYFDRATTDRRAPPSA